MGFFSLFNNSFNKPETISISKVIEKINQEEVERIAVSGNELTVILKDGQELVSRKEPVDSLSSLMADYQVDPNKLKSVEVVIEEDSGFGFW